MRYVYWVFNLYHQNFRKFFKTQKGLTTTLNELRVCVKKIIIDEIIKKSKDLGKRKQQKLIVTTFLQLTKIPFCILGVKIIIIMCVVATGTKLMLPPAEGHPK